MSTLRALAERLHDYAVDLQGKGGSLEDDVRPDLLEAAEQLEQYAVLLAQHKRTDEAEGTLYEIETLLRIHRRGAR